MISERQTVPASRFAERLERAVAATQEGDLEAMLIGVGSDMRYLTGYAAMPLERLTLLVLGQGVAPFMVVPRLELAAAEAGIRTDLEIRTWDETDDPYGLAVSGITTTGRVAVSDTMLAMHLLRIQAALGHGPTYLPASTVLRGPADDQGRRRDLPASCRRVCRGSGRRRDRRRQAGRAGPSRTSLERSASGSSTRVTKRRCSRSSHQGRTRHRRITRHPSG